MINSVTTPSLEHSFQPVKPQLNTQLPLFPDSVIHHKVRKSRTYKIVSYNRIQIDKPYGVSSASKLLPVSLFRKKYQPIKRCLHDVIGLPDRQVEGIMRLLRIQAYYRHAYPKASQIACDFDDSPPSWYSPYTCRVVRKRVSRGCSKASYWRAIRALEKLGLITVINRYILRPHAQISNLYHLDKLLLVIARYLAEHGVPFYEKWLQPYLSMPGSLFWPSLGGQLSPRPGSPALGNN